MTNSGRRKARIIPAYAGSTARARPRSRKGRDHPRVCGEHERCPSRTGCLSGSSPRMRGARGARAPLEVQAGIIPAYAGSTPRCAARRESARDHPRVCGEHEVDQLWWWACAGSSPRMRGAPRGPRRRVEPRGIIPAYAGSTRICRRPRSAAGDHPRVCGEHRSSAPATGSAPGSSPRMRGALRR